MTAGAPKSSNNVTSTFFNTVHLLPKDLKFEHGGIKLASCPGRCLTSLRLCTVVSHAPGIRCEYLHHTGEACFACGCRNPTVKPALSSKYMQGVTRLDGARGKKQIRRPLGNRRPNGRSLAPLWSNLSFFEGKFIVLKKVLVTLLGLFGAFSSNSAPLQWFSAPIVNWRPGSCGLLDPLVTHLSIWREKLL